METIRSILARIGTQTLKNITDPVSNLPESRPATEFAPPPEHCICNGSGFFRVDVPIDHRWFGKAHPCICSVHKSQDTYRRWLWDESRIPEAYLRKSLNEFDTSHDGNKKARQAILDFVTGKMETPWLVIQGKYGNGKTHLCTTAIRALVMQGVPALYAFVPDLLKDLQRGFDDKTYFVVSDAWKKAKILALDDLGTEYNSDWVRSELEELLDYRYREWLPTIIATNKALEELTPRIARRISDKTTCTLIVNTADEYKKAS